MAVYYKFKSARDYDSVPMDGPFISVGILKEKIFESKHLGRGTDFDLVVSNAQTNEEYLDEAMLIPKSTSVLIRRVPGRPRMPIITDQEPKVELKVEDASPEKSNFTGHNSSAMKYTDDTEWDEFGNDLYSIPNNLPVQSTITLPEAPPTNKADEDSKIKTLIDTPALDWQRQGADGFYPGRGFGRVMGGRIGGRGYGLERKTPPQGYVCHRCKVPGHFIQHCPTNGDPNYDMKRVKPPTGIPKSMLMPTPDGSYALPSGVVAVLKPNEAAFEKEIEGLPSTRSVGDFPPELHCSLCKEVMKDAVLTSKCCFKSFCDKCMREYIISKSQCVCGATNILADDLLPNKTLRDTINRILESGTSSAENAGSVSQVQDMESARCLPPKVASPTMSAASKGEPKPSVANEKAPKPDMNVIKNEEPLGARQEFPEKVGTGRVVNMSEATHESLSIKEAASQGSARLAEEEVQQKVAPEEAVKKKKKKKVHLPATDLWKASQDHAPEGYMIPHGPSVFNPYWNGFQPGMEGYMAPFAASPMPLMGYGMVPFDMPFSGVMLPDPFAAPGYMMAGVPPQRDLAELSFGMNAGPPATGRAPAMSREEFEAWKANVRRRHENERRAERESSRDREYGREATSSANVSSMKSRSIIPQLSSGGQRHRPERLSPERDPRDMEPLLPPRPSKIKLSDQYHHQDGLDRSSDRDLDRQRDRDRHLNHHSSSRDREEDRHLHHNQRQQRISDSLVKATSETTASDRKLNSSVFSRMSVVEGKGEAAAGGSKKRKTSSSGDHQHHKLSGLPNGNGYYYYKEDERPTNTKRSGIGSGSARGDYEASDEEEDRHFKRKKPSR